MRASSWCLLRNRLHDASHDLRLVLGDVGERLAVEAVLALGERAHELRERGAVLLGDSRDLGLPESAHGALLLLAVGEGVAACVVQGFAGLCLLGRASETEALRSLEHVAAALVLYYSSFYA